MKTPDHILNKNQVYILKLIFKFRFVTPNLLAQCKHVSHTTAYKSLEVLASHGYLGSDKNPRYRQINKSFRYYLTPKAARVLRDEHDIDRAALHSVYKNQSVTATYVDHYIDTFAAYLHVRDNYPDIFDIYTRSELTSHTAFPDKKPDLYLNRIQPSTDSTNEYLLELHHDSPLFFVIKKRLITLINHLEEEGWDNELYPTLLFVLADANTEKRFQKFAQETLDATGIEDELPILTTTIKPLLDQMSPKVIWTSVLKPEMLLTL